MVTKTIMNKPTLKPHNIPSAPLGVDSNDPATNATIIPTANVKINALKFFMACRNVDVNQSIDTRTKFIVAATTKYNGKSVKKK